MRILVVDDVGYVRHYFDRMLTQNGHSVLTAASGLQALELLKQDFAIQVVITDLLMPGMDGIELFRAAQKIDRQEAAGTLPRPAFYLITALRSSASTPHRETNMLQQALQMGFEEVLLKPIDNEHLLRQLTNLEQKLLRGAPHENSRAVSNRELLCTTLQNVERVLCCEDREVLVQLTGLMRETLDRIPRIIELLDAQAAEGPINSEPALSGNRSTGAERP
jgi:CheY-like chemotaxis protein